jgi:predicted TIM-barrel fold metal-dependent hydrolase
VNVDDLVAVDVHVHTEVAADGHPALPERLMAASARYFRVDGDRQPGIPQIAEYYRQRRMAAVVFAVDAESATGHTPVGCEEVAEACAEHADVLIPFGSVDPWWGAAVRRARWLVERYGVRGFTFHPSLQAFYPNDRMVYPLYEVLQELGMVALFHSGQTGIDPQQSGGSAACSGTFAQVALSISRPSKGVIARAPRYGPLLAGADVGHRRVGMTASTRPHTTRSSPTAASGLSAAASACPA